MGIDLDVLSKHVLSNYNKTIELAAPLKKLRVNHFCFVENDDDGKSCMLTTYPEYVIESVKSETYGHWFNLKHPSKLGDIQCALSLSPLNPRNETIRESHALDSHGVLIVKKLQNKAQFFYFWTSPENEDFLMDHRDLLEEYIQYFRRESLPSLNYARNNSFLIPDELQFACLESVNVKKELQITLPPQQKRCVDLLKKGFTAKEIASEMQLTEQTIHSYYKIIKRKTKAKTLAHLISLF